MSQNPHKGKRLRRYEHPVRVVRDTGHGRSKVQVVTNHTEGHSSSTGFHVRPSDHGHARLAAADSPATASFDMLSVEPSPTSTQGSSEQQTTQRSGSQALDSESTARVGASSSSQVFSAPVSSTTMESVLTSKEGETSTALGTPQQLQAELTSSVERTTLIVPATFSFPSSTLGPLSSTSTPSTITAARPTTWTRPIPTTTHKPSPSASANPIVQPPISHPHISPALIVFMVIGGFGALGLSLYVFRRVRYRALHVSRSQFQITSPSGHGGSGGVLGSESNKSFVSGGLGRLGHSNKQKNGVDAGNETPLWGGREKFSPQLGYGAVDLPPPAHLNERIPVNRRRSVMDTLRRNIPGRLSRHGPGWNTIPDAPAVPTVRITDMDTNHHRGASGSSFSESPDPNLASIQVASVTRTLSATASYRDSPSPRPPSGLEHPRPAPRAPPKAALKAPPKVEIRDWVPPVPKIPDIPGITTLPAGQKKHMDVGGRSKIVVADISKPRPVATVKSSQTVAETDPMAMYAKYSAGLGVRDDSPGPIRRETSMARKIAQIASSNTRPMIAPTVSQASLSTYDTRALAAAAGVASPTPSEDRALSRNDKKLTTGNSSLPNLPGTPGLSEVGNVMLRPFGQSGSMIPANLETPAIGLDGRSSYLSTNLGTEAIWRDRTSSNGGRGSGPLHAITAKPATMTSENDISTLAASLHLSAADDSDRRTIMSAYSQDFVPLSQQAHMQQNPDYRSPTYSIYNYYGPDRISRMPSMINGEREPEIGGAM